MANVLDTMDENEHRIREYFLKLKVQMKRATWLAKYSEKTKLFPSIDTMPDDS